jgi:hypothetical protein
MYFDDEEDFISESTDDFHTFNSQGYFDESWQAEEFTEDDVRELTNAYWDDLLESDI